jgi:hypothetical protein
MTKISHVFQKIIKIYHREASRHDEPTTAVSAIRFESDRDLTKLRVWTLVDSHNLSDPMIGNVNAMPLPQVRD